MHILLSPRNDFINTNPFLFTRCGYPCAHVLKVTNELPLEMIKVQNWKLYATHYNYDDDTFGIGLELTKLQLQYSNYEGMGVPISMEILTSFFRWFVSLLF
jgi:hypothetical protein